MTLSAHNRARRIKIILFDVDGVLTDGTILVIPAQVAGPDGTITKMIEAKGFMPPSRASVTPAT